VVKLLLSTAHPKQNSTKMQRSMVHSIQRTCLLFSLSSVAAFNGQPSLPAFGLHHQRPQLSQNQGSATELTARRPLSPPPPAFAPRTQTPPPPPRISSRQRVAARRADESTQVVAARHRYRDVAAPTPDLVRCELARWRHQAVNALCYARIALTTGLVWLVHAIAAPLHKQLGCSNFAASSLDHCIQLSRLFLGLARKQKDARTCLAKPVWWQVAPHGKCYADGGECFLL
jgi:hypothetical protein